MNQNRIRELRKENKLTQDQFAESLATEDFSVEQDTISKIERGERQLSPKIALRISQTYNVSLDWLNGVTDVRTSGINDATAILSILQNVFQLRPTELSYEFPQGIVAFPYYQLTINEHLDKLLNSVTQANIFFRDKGLPEEGYKGWIEGSKRTYNESIKDKASVESKDWILLPADLFTQELIAVICEDYLIKTQAE